MPEKPHIPFVPPTFSWDIPNLYTQYKIFKQKVDFAFKGLYKDNDAASKVCAILNWLGNNAYEIYEHLHWLQVMTKMTQRKCWKHFRLILSLNRTSSIHGTHWALYTVVSLSANMTS